MAVRLQSSTSSLAKYASAKSPGVDLYNGSKSRDFCNSFWGTGDYGANILFARMRGAARTTDGMRNFWKERAQIEEEYAKKLLDLSRMVFGKDEVGELRNALDTLHSETEKMAKAHMDLSEQLRTDLEEPTVALLNKQLEHRKVVQSPVERRFKAKQSQESYVVKAREKYEGDRLRIASYTKLIEQQGPELERIRQKLRRAEQTVGANEKDYENFCKALGDMLPAWESDWKDFCDSCQDMEEERLDFMKDNLWAYANAVSVVCVADDVSCEAIRTVLDQLETERDIESFVQEYGTGNSLPNAPEARPIEHNPSSSSTSLHLPPLVTSSRQAKFARKSRRPPPTVSQPPEEDQPVNKNGTSPPVIDNPTKPPLPTQSPPPVSPKVPVPPLVETTPPPPVFVDRNSKPMPPHPNQAPHPGTAGPPHPPPEQQPEDPGRPILFYVEALYDYTATIDEEFSFQAGDIIAVTATPDDGWWSGELLDENRRVEGRHVFPSNFVRLF
ncbi:hypothetical protein E1B28_010358 [Marasmius oreades]|uniref:SH3 domain-containing protein n=1 Tax=Marasmius oreades TaxID=181124 RepID=A0A9P7RXL1_9AGAR|nr:uncharacterized protein E1B28_010358 [Marasmius oreades]KAG7091313.1 hypothetical protein E1B28_010358 [Marasmius oreades]